MKKHLFALIIIASLIFGCGSGATATDTQAPPTPSNTPLPPAATATSPPLTATPVAPTATPVPPTATPVPSTPTPPSIPAARGYHQMAYDVESDRVILFGGCGSGGRCFDDTWAYDVSTRTWTKMNPAQSPPLLGGPMAYDLQSDRVIMFVGYTNPNNRAIGHPLGETWAYDYNSDTWTNTEPAEGPFDRLFAGMAYDVESDRMILFGGWQSPDTSATRLDETWAFDYDTNTWTKMDPEVRPSARSGFGITYHADSDRVLVWGGSARSHRFSVWAYDFNADAWEELTTSEVTVVGEFSSMAYVAETGKVVLVGAGISPEGQNSETWTYNYQNNSWSKAYKTSVGAKHRHAMAYNTRANRIVLFGGGPMGGAYNPNTDETWIYDPSAGSWENVSSNP